jgi:hypothetical protein
MPVADNGSIPGKSLSVGADLTLDTSMLMDYGIRRAVLISISHFSTNRVLDGLE